MEFVGFFQILIIPNPAPQAPIRAKDSRRVGTGALERPPKGIDDSGRTCKPRSLQGGGGAPK